ncbi:arylsulfatase [Parapedobacter sp. DT-150]|uniref:arylsulfatase n=1 Tax=Parapedobacter sp. DT-150 TaxID=3396162 RepID=UPI003F1BC1A9
MLKKRIIFLMLIAGLSAYAASKASRFDSDRKPASTTRPNIIVILADDMGYSDIGCYGGEVNTPTIDQLAAEGIRYKQFYNAARCCPTRAALISGLYPHQAGMGWMAAADLGTPAYQGNLNTQAVTIAEVLKTAGYGTYMTGKWHLTNERKIDGMVTDSWPIQRGFDRYFGIIPGGANYFTPVVYSGNHRYKAPKDFYLTDAISDTSVQYIHDHFTEHPDKPMFMYVAYTAPHWPLHALQKDIDKYKDVYKTGWDNLRKQRFQRQKALGMFPKDAILSPRDSAIKAWDRLSETEKDEMAMRMAIYAAQIDNMDQGIGRIIAKLKAENQLDNTLIFFLSDNGACAEFISSGTRKAVDGKEDTFESYRINWANVSSTPFKEYKHYTYEGGIATPLIVHWPNGIAKKLTNSFVSDYGHLSDIMATCVEVADAEYPAVYNGNTIHPMAGKSLVPHFSGKDNNRGKIFWEHEANIAVRDGKWKLVAKTPEGQPFDESDLRLYDMEADPIEGNDLSAQHPDQVRQLYAEWLEWGERVGVFPLDTREYNERARTYRRTINGSFDDNLGGWNVRISPEAKAAITIDTTGALTGRRSASVHVEKPGPRPAAIAMDWPFSAHKGERFAISVKARAEKNTAYYLRLEQVDAGAPRLMDQKILVSAHPGKSSFLSAAIPADGRYRVSLYFGDLNPGDKLWIDDIELKPQGD